MSNTAFIDGPGGPSDRPRRITITDLRHTADELLPTDELVPMRGYSSLLAVFADDGRNVERGWVSKEDLSAWRASQ